MKRKPFLLFLLLCSSIIPSPAVFGRHSIFKIADRSFGISVMPEYQLTSIGISNRIFKLSYSAGLNYSEVYTNAMELKTGFNFSNIWDQGNWTLYTRWRERDRSYSSKPLNDSLIKNTQYGRALRFLDIPIQFGYRFSNNKMKFSIFGGVIFSHVLNQKVVSKIELIDNKIVTNVNVVALTYLNVVQFSPVIGISLEKEINRDFLLKLEPTIRYQTLRHKFSEYDHFWIIGLNLIFTKRIPV
jgi:hypothetical protein